MVDTRPKYYQRRIKYLPDEELPGELNEALVQFGASSGATLKRLKVLMELMIQRQRADLQQIPVTTLSSDEIARETVFRTGVIYGFTMVQRFAEEAIEGNLDPHNYPDLGFDTTPITPPPQDDEDEEWEDL